MKLTYAKYNLEIEMKENQVNVLIIENPIYMAEIIEGLQKQCDGEEGEMVLSRENKIIKFDKYADVILNPFSLHFNDRKIVNKLYTQLQEIATDNWEEKEKLNSEFIRLLDQVISSCPYTNITYNLSCEWNDLFKLYDVGITALSDRLLDRLIEYIKILSHLTEIELLYLVNLKSYLTSEELKELYQMAYYNKIYLLLIEPFEREELEGEKQYIIDKDMCLIIK